jgi:DNA-binding PadR family transcriptional regulator
LVQHLWTPDAISQAGDREMTPYEIKLLLHYFTTPDDHPDVERDPPVWRPTIQQFLADGLLEHGDERDEATYRISDRGKAFCEALLVVPLPVMRWVTPWPKSEALDR